MITTLFTGGNRDYVQLVAETLDECNSLCLIANSKFIEDDRVWLDLSRQVMTDGVTQDTVALRIWVSTERSNKGLGQVEREELDQTS